MPSSHTGFLDPPGPLLGVDVTAFWLVNAACMALVAASVVVAVAEARRHRSALPLLLLASGALWLPNEPFVDTVLGFQYAGDAPGTLFTLAGRPIPIAAIAVGSMFSMFTWFVYRLVITGRSQRTILGVALAAGVIDWPMEMLASHFHVYEYYGDNPTRIFGLPWTSMIQNCSLYLFMAAVFILAVPYLRGWRALLFLPVLPACYWMVAFLCTWPAYLALHGRWSTGVFLALGVISGAMNAYLPVAALHIARDVHEARERASASPAIPLTQGRGEPLPA